jgi:hypothetical protein
MQLYTSTCIRDLHVCSALRAAERCTLQVPCLSKRIYKTRRNETQTLATRQRERKRENTSIVSSTAILLQYASFVRETTVSMTSKSRAFHLPSCSGWNEQEFTTRLTTD